MTWDRDTIERALPAWIEGRPWSHGAHLKEAKVRALLPLPGAEHARVAIVTDDLDRVFAIPLAKDEGGVAIAGDVIDGLTVPAVGEALVKAREESSDSGYTLRFHTRTAKAQRWVAKVIHTLEGGESPELEVVRFLNAAGYRYVAPLAGWSDVVHDDRASTFAIIEGFVPRKGTALDNLREELNRWFDEVLQMGDIDPPKLAANDILSRALFPLSDDVNVAVGDYIRTAALLGARVGEMHKLLARTDVEAFAPAPLDLAARDRIVRDITTAVGDIFALLDVRAPSQREKVQNAIAALRAKKPTIEKRVQNLLVAPEGAVRIRIHGDLRLERVLYTGDDFVIDGFEGDRTRPLAERKSKRSPIEDVATMLRSIHREVTHILAERPDAERPKLGPWASVFHRAASASFLGGWLRSASESTVLPAAPVATRALLDAFLIRACVRELDTEDAWDLEVGLEGLREVLENERKPGQLRTSRSFSPFSTSLKAVKVEPSRLDPEDPQIKAFKEGTATHAHRIFGAHHRSDGYTELAVWAPNAIQVAVVGDFNDWSGDAGLLAKLGETGIYAGRVRAARVGQRYMFRIPGADDSPPRDKADPFAQALENGGRHASVIARGEYAWGDAKWMQARRASAKVDRPISILEVEVDAGYRDIALSLAARARSLGFTHVELHFPRDGFFAPAVHFGTTEDLMFLVDTLHQDGIGVFFAWSPAEFTPNEAGLAEFDGMPTFESDDSTRQVHPVSGQGLFDLGKPAVQSFLLSSALFWVEELHADGLRIDNLATAVYLDDRRAPGTWSPNAKGGRENLEGFAFIQRLVKTLKSKHPAVHVIADDSITKSTDVSSLGFDRRCDATWVDDLRFHLGLAARARAHHDLPELPTATDVVVAIDGAAAAENLDLAARKLFLAIAWALPGKKLLLMSEDGAMSPTIADLNRVYQQTAGLQGAEISRVESGPDILAFKRGEVLVVANLSHETRTDAAVSGRWKVLLDTGRETDETSVLESPPIPPRSALFLVPA